MKFYVKVDPQEDGTWVADCPTVPGCTSRGASRDEALANLEETIKDRVQERAGPETPISIEVEHAKASG